MPPADVGGAVAAARPPWFGVARQPAKVVDGPVQPKPAHLPLRASAWADPRERCECFSLCHPRDVERFYRRLGVVQNVTSPWHAYLRVVYGGAPLLPFELGQLSMWYTSLLPTAFELCPQNVTRCPAELCDGWLSPTELRGGGKSTTSFFYPWINGSSWKSARSFQSKVRSEYVRRAPFSLWVMRQAAQRVAPLSGAWMEVLRVGTERWHSRHALKHREGRDGYGCWFWEARGSGVWLNVGTDRLAFADRKMAHLHGMPPGSQDYLYARAILARNATTMQITHSNTAIFGGRSTRPPWEIILAVPSCMEGNVVPDACPPDAVELRGGLDASGRCTCQVNAAGLRPDIINCAQMRQRLLTTAVAPAEVSRRGTATATMRELLLAAAAAPAEMSQLMREQLLAAAAASDADRHPPPRAPRHAPPLPSAPAEVSLGTAAACGDVAVHVVPDLPVPLANRSCAHGSSSSCIRGACCTPSGNGWNSLNLCRAGESACLGKPLNLAASANSPVASLTRETNEYLLAAHFKERLAACSVAPERADLVLVPYLVGELKALRSLGAATVDGSYDARIRSHLAQTAAWRRCGGCDHVLVLSHDVVFLRRRSFATGFGFRPGDGFWSNVTMLSICADPRVPQSFGVPYPSFVHASGPEDMAAWSRFVLGRQRHRRLMLVSGRHGTIGRDHGRSRIMHGCQHDESCHLHSCDGKHACEPQKVAALYLDSVFCLQPPGDAVCRRGVWDALLSGCIPVTFPAMGAGMMPGASLTRIYPWFLPPGTPALVEADDYRDAAEKVRSMPDAEMRERQHAIAELLPRLAYATSFAAGEDAVATALRSARERVRALRARREIAGSFL